MRKMRGLPDRPPTTHVAIGNTDDRLSQLRWHEFVGAVDTAVRRHGEPIYGFWVSPSAEPYQNAAWAFQPRTVADRDALRAELARVAGDFDQDSVAWNESETELLRPSGETEPLFPL